MGDIKIIMLQSIQSLISSSTSKLSLSDYNQYIKNLSNNSKSYIKRFQKKDISSSSNFQKFITSILDSYPLNYIEIEKLSDDFNLIDYITNMLTEHVGNLEFFIHKNPYSNIFFISKSNNLNVECYLIFQNSFPYKYLPINKNLKEFKDFYPIKLIYTDTKEYSLLIIHDKINHNFLPADYSFFTIDIHMLLFMWFKYVKIKLIKKEKIDKFFFFKNYIFYPLVYQHQDIIIFNCIVNLMKEMILDIEMNEIGIYELDIFALNKFNFIKYNSQKIIKNFKDILGKFSKGNLTPTQFLNGIKLPTGISISNMINNLIDLKNPANDIRFNWMIFVKDIKFLSFLFYLFSIYRNKQNYVYLKRILFSIYNAYNSEKFWNHISNIDFRDYVKNNLFKEFETLIE